MLYDTEYARFPLPSTLYSSRGRYQTVAGVLISLELQQLRVDFYMALMSEFSEP
jgi:hypothetical protein